MGAEYQEVRLDAKREDLAARFRVLQDQHGYEYGHGYSGSFAECHGLEITDESFNHKEEASEWLQDHAKKFGPALAVRVGWEWIIGAWCSS